VALVRVLIMRKLTIILAAVIVFLAGVAMLVAHYASTGEHNEPVKRVRGL
jgi:hypothetical protein